MNVVIVANGVTRRGLVLLGGVPNWPPLRHVVIFNTRGLKQMRMFFEGQPLLLSYFSRHQ